jgi:UDP-glucose 4-epimerase
MSRPNAALVAEFYPEVEVRGDLGEHDTMLSIEKAKQLLGYRPAYGWRHLGTS